MRSDEEGRSMKGLARSIAALVGAGILPASAILAGQAPKAQAPAGATAIKVEVKVEAKPTVEVKSDDPKIEVGADKAAAKVEARATVKAAAVVKAAPVGLAVGNLEPWTQRFVVQ